MKNSILCDGVVVSGGSVHNSILSNDVRVEQDSSVEDSLIFEGVQVGEGTRLRGCIIDKFVDIPAGESIGFDPLLDAERFTISGAGIVVVPKQYRFGFSVVAEASRQLARPVR